MANVYASLSDDEKSLLKPQHELKELIGLFESVYPNLALPAVPRFESLKSFKEFCSDLIEGRNHRFDGALSQHSPIVRCSLASSLFLFRKRLPSLRNPLLKQEFCCKMSSPTGKVDPSFIKFCDKMIPRIFGPGWDRSYNKRVNSSTLSTSACLESKKADGGCRGSGLNRERFLKYALGETPIPYNPLVKVSVVRQDGKDRLVTIGDSVRGVLSPLHSIIYDHLSRKPWLLRGDAKPKSFPDFTAKTGEVFVSGDYESATDNIPLELYEHILDRVLNTASNVPSSVLNFARENARSTLVNDGLHYSQKRGQLMGNLLSFPFLCLINFLIFKYVIRRRVPLMINGDDIVFRATRDEARKWMDKVGECGLVLSVGKTLVDHRLFSLNSTFFRSTSRTVHFVPFLRSKAYFSKPESIDALRGQYESFCPGFGGTNRSILRSRFITKWKHMVYLSQRSISRGLEMKASRSCLKRCGMWDRERFYLKLPKELPLPPAPSEIRWEGIPEGWVRRDISKLSSDSKKRLLLEESEYRDLQYQLAWTGRFTRNDLATEWDKYWKSVRRDTFRYRPLDVGKLCRLLGLTKSGFVNYLASTDPNVHKYVRRTYCWVREEKKAYDPPVAGVEEGKCHIDVAVMGTARFPFFIKTRSSETRKQWAKPVSFEGQIRYGGILRQMSDGPSPFRWIWKQSARTGDSGCWVF